MKAFWMFLAVIGALLVQSTLSRVSAPVAHTLDPFLLVLVYCALTGGETQGMLAGAVAGWIQDVHFGGTVLGLTGLTDLIVGFGVGAASTRFLLVGTLPRLLVVGGATLAQALLLDRCAAIFALQIHTLTLRFLLLRCLTTALVGVLIYEMIDFRLRSRELRT